MTWRKNRPIRRKLLQQPQPASESPAGFSFPAADGQGFGPAVDRFGVKDPGWVARGLVRWDRDGA